MEKITRDNCSFNSWLMADKISVTGILHSKGRLQGLENEYVIPEPLRMRAQDYGKNVIYGGEWARTTIVVATSEE